MEVKKNFEDFSFIVVVKVMSIYFIVLDMDARVVWMPRIFDSA